MMQGKGDTVTLLAITLTLGIASLPLQTPETPPPLATLLAQLAGEDPVAARIALGRLSRMDLAPHGDTVRPVLAGLLGAEDVLFREQIAKLLLVVDPADAPARGVLEQIDRDNRLIEAIWAKDLEAVRAALASGAAIDGRYVDRGRFLDQGNSYYTPAIAAVVTGETEILELLLEKAPDLELTRNRRTALHYAVRMGDAKSIELLKAAGAAGDPEKMAWCERLTRSACRGFVLVPGAGYPHYPGVPRGVEDAEELSVLLDSGGEIDVRDPDGHTPLMFAANAGLAENVRILLLKGADPRLETDGMTALSLARRSLERLESLPPRPDGIEEPESKGGLREVGRTPQVEAKILEYRAVILLLEI